MSKAIYATLTVALPLPRLCDDISISLSRASALVNSCSLFGPRSGGRGHGSHDVIEDNVIDRAREVGRLVVDGPRRCECAV